MVFQIDPMTRHERCSDDESDSYPWIGYHLSSIRRGVCLALRSWSGCTIAVLQPIERTDDTAATAVQHVRIDHRSTHVPVSQ